MALAFAAMVGAKHESGGVAKSDEGVWFSVAVFLQVDCSSIIEHAKVIVQDNNLDSGTSCACDVCALGLPVH